jgi:hypothetical protein
MSSLDGGPAFPVPASDAENVFGEMNGNVHAPGMSLRDYFAGKVLGVILLSEEFAAWRKNQYEGGSGGNIYSPLSKTSETADFCYEMADAMLVART